MGFPRLAGPFIPTSVKREVAVEGATPQADLRTSSRRKRRPSWTTGMATLLVRGDVLGVTARPDLHDHSRVGGGVGERPVQPLAILADYGVGHIEKRGRSNPLAEGVDS
jgi:hypothetical protein